MLTVSSLFTPCLLETKKLPLFSLKYFYSHAKRNEHSEKNYLVCSVWQSHVQSSILPKKQIRKFLM